MQSGLTVELWPHISTAELISPKSATIRAFLLHFSALSASPSAGLVQIVPNRSLDGIDSIDKLVRMCQVQRLLNSREKPFLANLRTISQEKQSVKSAALPVILSNAACACASALASHLRFPPIPQYCDQDDDRFELQLPQTVIKHLPSVPTWVSVALGSHNSDLSLRKASSSSNQHLGVRVLSQRLATSTASLTAPSPASFSFSPSLQTCKYPSSCMFISLHPSSSSLHIETTYTTSSASYL